MNRDPTAGHSMVGHPSLVITPLSGRIDERVHIRVVGLAAGQWVALHAEQGRVSTGYVERVRELMPSFSAYFAGIPLTAFLDDTTTKNVLIQDGRLSGIVDVDFVCFGDPLFTVALTQMALLSMGADLDYTDAWCAALALDAYQRTALTFYTCVFCVDFMREVGHDANQNNATANEAQRIERLTTIFERLLCEIE